MSTSSTVSAMPITSTSLWPAPTVSTKIMSFPAASRTRTAWSAASASPPRWPRVPSRRRATARTLSAPAELAGRRDDDRDAAPARRRVLGGYLLRDELRRLSGRRDVDDEFDAERARDVHERLEVRIRLAGF